MLEKKTEPRWDFDAAELEDDDSLWYCWHGRAYAIRCRTCFEMPLSDVEKISPQEYEETSIETFLTRRGLST